MPDVSPLVAQDHEGSQGAPPVASPRRTFIGRLAALVAAWPLAQPVAGRRVARAMPAEADGLARPGDAPSQPNVGLLSALGSAVLPSELGAQGTTGAVAEFQRWMDGYRAGAEVNHGYGTGRIDHLPADPRPQWSAQLTALDSEARRAHGKSFAALARVDRQALVRAALAGERGESLPSALAAKHVATALLAHFYESPAATDLCYEAAIGRQQCRPLAAQREAPVPLARRGR
jgi:hypothetical protein